MDIPVILTSHSGADGVARDATSNGDQMSSWLTILV